MLGWRPPNTRIRCPFYRQAVRLRFGGDLLCNTLAGSMIKVGEAVQPIINLLRDHQFDAELVFEPWEAAARTKRR